MKIKSVGAPNHLPFFLARHPGGSPPMLHKARVEVYGIKARHDMNPKTLRNETRSDPREEIA